MEFLPWLSFEDAMLTAWCFLQSIRELRAIQTDRLHVAIGAALCGVQCELHDNLYGKNRAVYQHSLAGRFPQVTMSDKILAGAPSQGIPALFRSCLPEAIRIMDAPATAEEVCLANRVRQEFAVSNQQSAYLVDKVRAFRALKGATVYVEVGTRDKANLAWVCDSLAEDALIIDVDLVHCAESEEKLRTRLRPLQKYHKIEGGSADTLTIANVKRALGWHQADAIFLDTSHMYDQFLKEVDLYMPLIRPGGLLMFYDVLWEGDENGKGKAQAALALDRFTPVYSVLMDLPVHRFIPRESKLDSWGGIGVIIKD
jgi:predicted O-methyltransferase YrrM